MERVKLTNHNRTVEVGKGRQCKYCVQNLPVKLDLKSQLILVKGDFKSMIRTASLFSVTAICWVEKEFPKLETLDISAGRVSLELLNGSLPIPICAGENFAVEFPLSDPKT